MSLNYEPTAAKRIYGVEQCEYECENRADWRVEINHESTIDCCDGCAAENRLHPRDVREQGFTTDG